MHGGGDNNSVKSRNALIMQAVWFFGLGQQKFDAPRIMANLEKELENQR